MAQAVAAVDPLQSIGRAWSFSMALSNASERQRASALLLSFLAALALCLALAGTYAINSLSVQARSREFGLRMAVGAREIDVTRIVLHDAIVLTSCGIAGGIAIVACASRILRHLLYGVSPLDPLSLVVAIGLVFGCTVAAAAVPARRASRIDPATALRTE
jgi:ABC-type antimicrobial peptide transport system permease subunit